MFEKMSRRLISAVMVVLVCVVVTIFGIGRHGTDLTDAEFFAIESICGMETVNFEDVTIEALTKEVMKKFTAVQKVYVYRSLYAFIVQPVGYNGPVTLAVVIDDDSGACAGIRIVEHMETDHYVRDMDSKWFVERFTGKPAQEYLEPVRLIARNDNEIVAITGATVTTEAIINGVNAAFGVYREYVLKQTADAVPYMVHFEPGEGEGPVETESLAIRAYGVVLAEVSLEDIKALPSVKRTFSIHSSTGTTQHNFTGTLLSNVLDSSGVEFRNEYRWALAVGVDDYISDISVDEILEENNVFVMYEDDGEPLLKKNGEPGAMRIVVINDTFGQRFTNYLLEIVLENDKDMLR